MALRDQILYILLFVLIIVTVILGIRTSTYAERDTQARAMTTEVIQLVREQSYPSIFPECRTLSERSYETLQQCIVAARSASDLTKMFAEDKYQGFDARTNRTGYLVITNEKGGKSFESAKFSLFFNNEEIARECEAQGMIAPGYTCRFDLAQPCEPGDNLEVRYEGKRAHLKTC